MRHYVSPRKEMRLLFLPYPCEVPLNLSTGKSTENSKHGRFLRQKDEGPLYTIIGEAFMCFGT